MDNEDQDKTPLLNESDMAESHRMECSDSLETSNASHNASHGEEYSGRRSVCCTKILSGLQSITVEPILLLDILGWSIQSSLTTNLLLEKVCVEKQYEPSICANLSSHDVEQAVVQREVNLINMYKDLMTALPNIFFVLFVGPWSDKYGRKIPLTLPLLGSLLAALILMGNSYCKNLPAMYILFSGIPQAFTGGFITVLMAAYAYMTDITKLRSRTTRIALMDFSFVIGYPLGIWLSDWIFYSLGYLGIYGVSGALFLIGIMYSILRIEDTRGPFSKLHLENTEFAERPNNMLRDLFDTGNVKSVVETCLKPRPNKGRGKLLALILSMFFYLFSNGMNNISYLFVKRQFGWNYDQFVHLGITKSIVTSLGIAIVLPVLSYKLQVHDSLLGLIGCTSASLCALITGFAPRPWYLYLGACVGSLGGLSALVNRSILSKIVPDGEIGKVFAMTASFEAAVPLMSSPLYTLVYNSTIEFFAGAVYLVTLAFFVVPAVTFLWLFRTRHLSLLEYHIHEEEIPDPDSC